MPNVPPGVIAGDVQYPNLPAVTQFQYTCSRGIGPGTVIIRTQVGQVPPPATGTILFSDGEHAFALRRVKLERFTVEKSDQGTEWSFEFKDARVWWKYSAISGWYNQLDPHGKLIPLTVKSPTELAKLCLEKLGVTRYALDMPPGLESSQVGNIPDFLPTGVNFPIVGVNPPINWYAESADNALAQLCDQTGRILAYDFITDSVIIARPGVGGDLPQGSLQCLSPGMTTPVLPAVISVVGDPIEFQVMLELYAVGIEWDGTLRPINKLSYAPLLSTALSNSPQIVTYTVTDAIPGRSYQAYVKFHNGDSLGSSYTCIPGNSENTIASNLSYQINVLIANRGLEDQYNAVSSNGVVTLTCSNTSQTFDAGGSLGVKVDVTQCAVGYLEGAGPVDRVIVPGGGVLGFTVQKVSWAFSPPPLFPGIRATPHLTLEQARALAQRSVFKMYRITGRDITSKKPGVFIPGHGKVRKSQIWLLDHMVDQVVPDKGDRNFTDINGDPLIRNVYDGYSRSRPSMVMGSVSASIFNTSYLGPGLLPNQPGNPPGAVGGPLAPDIQQAIAMGANTEEHTQVPIDFQTDPFYQTICFSNFVWVNGGGLQIQEPRLTLFTAVNIRDANTQQFVPYTYSIQTGGAGETIQILKRPDVQLGVSSQYQYLPKQKTWKFVSASILEVDPILRARYYAAGALNALRVVPGETARYNGLIPVRLDGRVAQVSYSIQGGSGCSTSASVNGEHDIWVPQYPARRRAENLPSTERDVHPLNRGRMDIPFNPMG